MSAADVFVDQLIGTWPRLEPNGFQGCSDDEIKMIQGMEELAINTELQSLRGYLKDYNDKMAFAMLFKALREDMHKTFSNPDLGNPRHSRAVNTTVRKMFVKIGEVKFHNMAMWFWKKWGFGEGITLFSGL